MVGCGAGLGMHQQQRPLLPLRMRDGDDGRLEHVGMRDHQILDLDRGDPFAAGLDDVLQAVRQLHITIGIDGRDVAGAEPAVVVDDLAALALEIA